MYDQGTVCFIRQDNKVLLCLIEYSPTTRIWNGIGGFLEEGETLEEAVVREIKEETYLILKPGDLKKVAEIPHLKFKLTVFLTDKWSGKIKIKEPTIKEMKWFDIDDLPFDQMHSDNKYWLPQVLEGKLIKKVVGGFIEVDSL